MVDNRGISPISSYSFTDANSSANKMSEEKYGQGGEYFASEMEEEQEAQQSFYQDRSAQLRASLNGLALANAASLRFMKAIKEKEENKNKNKRQQKNKENENNEEATNE